MMKAMNCLEGVRAKFHQNPSLMQMLKSTESKLVVEATTDRTWGTGIHLRDSNALNRKRWSMNGWLSNMVMSIWSDHYQ